MAVSVKELIIKSRFDWNAEEPLYTDPLEMPIKYLALSYIKPRREVEDEELALRHIQKLHMEEMNMPDIQSNFIIGKDGTVYEGRGWNVRPSLGEHPSLRQRKHEGRYLEVLFIGNYLKNQETNPLVRSCGLLLREGRVKGLIDKDFVFLDDMVIKQDGSAAHTITLKPNIFNK